MFQMKSSVLVLNENLHNIDYNHASISYYQKMLVLGLKFKLKKYDFFLQAKLGLGYKDNLCLNYD